MKNLQLLPSTLRDESIVIYHNKRIQTTNPIVQHYTPIWDVLEPNINGDYQDAIFLTFAQADNEDFTAHLEDKVLYFELSFVKNSVFN